MRELITQLRQVDGDMRVVRSGEDFMFYVQSVDVMADDDPTCGRGIDECESQAPMPSVVLIS
ncbi:MAG TPA: hypothetical protein VMF13_16440 [Luteitalea sp.]|nr:hypothetical protein [Luteitalea sp.]